MNLIPVWRPRVPERKVTLIGWRGHYTKKAPTMPKVIPIAVITNADGTPLDQWLPSLAEIAEATTVA